MKFIDHGLVDGIEYFGAIHGSNHAVRLGIVHPDVQSFEFLGEAGERSEVSRHGFLCRISVCWGWTYADAVHWNLQCTASTKIQWWLNRSLNCFGVFVWCRDIPGVGVVEVAAFNRFGH